MRAQIFYFWQYNGLTHTDIEKKVLAHVDFESRFIELLKYYPVLSSSGRYNTRNEYGEEKTPLYCNCTKCRKEGTYAEHKDIFDKVYNWEWQRISAIVNSDSDFKTKARAWIKERLDPFTRYTDNETISLIPNDPKDYEAYNRFVYNYLVESQTRLIRQMVFRFRVRDFEQRMHRAMYPEQLRSETKEKLLSDLGNHRIPLIRSTFKDLIAGKPLDWSTSTWSFNECYDKAIAHEGYLFLQYLEQYPPAHINQLFLQYVAEVFGDDDDGLSWSEIATYFCGKTSEIGVQLPYDGTRFPEDGSLINKKAGILMSFTAFSGSMWYRLVKDLTEQHPEIKGATELNHRLQALFGPLSQLYKGISHDLVEDVLNGMSEYPLAASKFRLGLEMAHQGLDYRGALDNLRLSLELFLKQFLRNDAPLEKQTQALGAYLKDKNVPVQVREMVTTLITQYRNYHNAHTKHNDKVEQADVNTLLYLTAIFILRILKTLVH